MLEKIEILDIVVHPKIKLLYGEGERIKSLMCHNKGIQEKAIVRFIKKVLLEFNK